MLLGILEGLWIDWIVSFRPPRFILILSSYSLEIYRSVWGTIRGTGRGIYFESKNTKAVLKLIHGCLEAVAGIKLKPTINY